MVVRARILFTPWVENTVLAVVAALDICILAFSLPFAVSGNQSLDFQWFGAHEFLHGRNPYQIALDHPDRVLLQQNPNYLPLLYILLTPLGAMSFEEARIVWALLNPLMYVGAAILIGRSVGLSGRGLFLFASLGAANVSFILVCANGQQTMLVMLASVVALFHSPARSGLGFAVAVTKYSFAPPLGIALLIRGRMRALAMAAGVTLAATLVFAGVTQTSILRSLVQPLIVSRSMMLGVADIMTLTGYVSGHDRTVLTYIAGVALCCMLTWGARKFLSRGSPAEVLACCMLIALACFPHLIYDYAVLMTLFAPAIRAQGWRRGVVVLTVIYFWYLRLILDQFVTPGSAWYGWVSFGVLIACYLALVLDRSDAAARRGRRRQLASCEQAPLVAGGGGSAVATRLSRRQATN